MSQIFHGLLVEAIGNTPTTPTTTPTIALRVGGVRCMPSR